MGDVMGDQYADNQTIQTQLQDCQKDAAAVQAELDRAVQNFGQGMQRGMEACQRQVQGAMQSGSITEQGMFTIFSESALTFGYYPISRTNSNRTYNSKK